MFKWSPPGQRTEPASPVSWSATPDLHIRGGSITSRLRPGEPRRRSHPGLRLRKWYRPETERRGDARESLGGLTHELETYIRLGSPRGWVLDHQYTRSGFCRHPPSLCIGSQISTVSNIVRRRWRKPANRKQSSPGVLRHHRRCPLWV